MCSAIIIAGGRGMPGGASAASRSAAARMMPKARSLAAMQGGVGIDGKPGFEHRRIERRLVAGESEIGLADPLERGDGVGAAVVPGLREQRLELLEAALRDAGQQFVAVAEMPVGRGRADAGHARGIGKGETGRALFRDQVERRLQQRLFQIAVMIAALGAALFLAPAHVKGFYMSRRKGH